MRPAGFTDADRARSARRRQADARLAEANRHASRCTPAARRVRPHEYRILAFVLRGWVATGVAEVSHIRIAKGVGCELTTDPRTREAKAPSHIGRALARLAALGYLDIDRAPTGYGEGANPHRWGRARCNRYTLKPNTTGGSGVVVPSRFSLVVPSIPKQVTTTDPPCSACGRPASMPCLLADPTYCGRLDLDPPVVIRRC